MSAGVGIVDAARAANIYNALKARYSDKSTGKMLPNVIIQPNSFLQLEIALQNGNAQYNFAINKSYGNPPLANSERRLDQNDAFAATAVALFIKKEDSTKRGSGILYSYPSPTVFTAEASNVATADLEAVFNSNLRVQVGNVVFAEAMDMRPSRYVRTAQKVAATTNQNGIANDEQLGTDGYIETAPFITFDGGDKNQLQLTIANWAGQLIQYSTANAGQTIYAVLKFYGFQITGGSGIGQVNNGY